MPGKILGIDISEHNISAVQVMSGLKGFQVISCFSTPITDNNPEKALENLSARFDLKSDKCILTIPSSDISFRNVDTAFRDAKKIRQTLPFEIETFVPFAIDEMVIDYNHTDENNASAIFTAAINKAYIAGYIDKFINAGVDPDIIDIRPVPAVLLLLDQERTPDSGIYLDLEYEHPCIVIFRNKKIVLIRELPCTSPEMTKDSKSEKDMYVSPESLEKFINAMCQEAGRTIHSFNSQTGNAFIAEKVFYGGSLSGYKDVSSILGTFFETPAERINISRDSRLRMDPGLSGIYEPAIMENALAACIREGKKHSGFNFRRGEFTVKRKIFGPGKDIRTVALLLSIFFVFMIINSSVNYYYLSKKHDMVEDEFNKEFDRKFPDKKGLGTQYKLLLVKQKLEESKNPSTDIGGIKSDQRVLDVLADISRRIPENYNIDVTTMQINNREVTISANTDSYNTVDKIANILKPSALFKSVDIINPGQTKNGIKFDLKLERAE